MANFEGAVNDTTLTCNVTNSSGEQVPTTWSVANLGGVPGVHIIAASITLTSSLFLISGDPGPNLSPTSFENHLTILNWTSALDGASLFCGTSDSPQQTRVLLKIYSKSRYYDLSKE